jgi:uncharacterized protein with von Willebrand factor type A (vWA) domain
MFVGFLYELRRRRISVGAEEAVALARALTLGLHESSLDGFYQVARAILVHSEAHLDDFDTAFSAHFRHIDVEAPAIAQELLGWLRNPAGRRDLSAEERAAIEALDLPEVLRRFEARLREQRERHDSGNHWIGTGGTSPFGRGGENPSGLSVGEGGGGKGGALKTADARRYRPYRSDVVLDVRQIELALRKLRGFTREGSHRELDVAGTIDATARNAGELEVVTRPPRRSNTRVILMMDVGGSMDPYVQLVSRLFSAAKRATHWRELRTYYFHNCIYGRVYKTDGLQDPVRVRDVMAACGTEYKLVIVGDAAMAPYELLGAPGYGEEGKVTGVAWLHALRGRFERSVWLNPEGIDANPYSTVGTIAEIFPMFSLTLEGLGHAVKELVAGGRRRRSTRLSCLAGK